MVMTSWQKTVRLVKRGGLLPELGVKEVVAVHFLQIFQKI
jgi:hypothetical protein